jgi:hypothetical protein
MSQLLELVMIVKNSGEVLRKCLQSVKPYIDRWTILDTGSSDNTPEIIKEEMKGKDGNLFFEPFIDFSTSRNRSLDLSSKTCKYSIILDDSYELYGGKLLRNMLKKSNSTSFSIKIGNIHGNYLESYYYNVRIIRSDLGLKYRSRVHEYVLDSTTEFIRDTQIYINDIKIIEHEMRTRMRNRKDIEFLMMEYGENPKDPRTLMYLARTYILLGEYKLAITYMDKMNALGKTIHREYQFFAKYEKACLEYAEIDRDENKFRKNMIEIQKKFTERCEPLYKITSLLYKSKQYEAVAKMMDKMIIFPKPEVYITILETMIYDYYIPYVYIDVNLKLGKIDNAIRVLREMLEKYPHDQPLLNMKYSVCKNDIKVETLSNGKTLVIHTGQIGWYWDPKKATSISGSEYMAMNIAKEFVRCGYRVFIFGQFEDFKKGIDYQGTYDGVQYIDEHYFLEFSMKYVIDYLIISRFVSNLVYYDNILNVYLWVHDIIPIINRNCPMFQTHLTKFKGIITLSEWHLRFVEKNLGTPKEMMILSRNAIDVERFREPIEKIPYRFIYISDANRGLAHLIDMIQKIKERYPETTLRVYTRLEQIEEGIFSIVKQLDYIQLNPRTDQKIIAVELLKSDIWLYPTDFAETYCISAVEAQAAGCLVASVKYGGLENTVGNRGVMGKHPISDTENRDELLKKLYYVIDRPEIKKQYTEKAREWAMQQTYKNLCLEWISMFK